MNLEVVANYCQQYTTMVNHNHIISKYLLYTEIFGKIQNQFIIKNR